MRPQFPTRRFSRRLRRRCDSDARGPRNYSAFVLAALLLGAAAGCLSSPAKPFPQEGPIRSPDRKVEVEIERFTSFDGKGGVYTGGLVRAIRKDGPLYGSTLWLARLDPGDEQDIDATLPVQGLLTLTIEGRPPDEVVAVRGPVGRPQRFRLADGVRVEE